MSVSSIVLKYLEKAVNEAKEYGYSDEDVARSSLSLVIEIYRKNRSIEEIADELTYCIENLDSDIDYAFMRP